MGTAALNIKAISSGPGWSLNHIACSAKGGERPFEEAHSSHVIAWVTHGSFSYHGHDGRQLLHSGLLLLGHAGECYSCGHRHDGGDTCLALKLTPEFFDEVSRIETGNSGFRFRHSRLVVTPEVETGFRTLLSDGQGAAADETVLALVAQVIGQLDGGLGPPACRLSDEMRVEASLNHAEHSLETNLSLDELARIAGLSKYHYLRVFRTVTGTTPYQHVLHLRLNRAAGLLADTQRPVTDISLVCGFGDLSTFNHHFKVRYGKSPTAFRRWGS